MLRICERNYYHQDNENKFSILERNMSDFDVFLQTVLSDMLICIYNNSYLKSWYLNLISKKDCTKN